MAPTFEPMSVGLILDRTFFLYRKNFVRFIAIVAVVQIPLGLLQLLLQRPTANSVSGPSTVLTLSLVMIGLFANQLCQGALVKSVAGSYLGDNVSVGQAYRFVLPKILTLIWAAILVMLAIFGGTLLLIIPGIIFGLWLVLTSQIVVLENLKATKAMGRSKALVKGSLGKVFALGFVAILITGIVSYIFQYGAGLVVRSMEMTLTSKLTAVQIMGLVGTVLTTPITAAAFILLYYDMRIRKEGFDLEMLAKSFGAETVATDASMPPQGPAA